MSWKHLQPVLLFVLAFAALAWGRGKVCLHFGDNIVEPVVLPASACVGANATVGCMARLYAYRNFRYNGPVQLLPNLGEIFIFLTLDVFDNLDAVFIMNPISKQTIIDTKVSFVGVNPTRALLIDDHPPVGQDRGYWDPVANKGEFNFTVQPTFTDGVVLGHLDFINHYCIHTSYVPRVVGQIQNITFLAGTFPNIFRAAVIPFTAAQIFSFCQFPIVEITKKDITGCPGGSNGFANITVNRFVGPAGNYSFVWKNSNNVTIGTGLGIYNLRAGQYTLVVTHSSTGCDTERTITILPPPAVVIETIEVGASADGNTGTASVTSVSNGQPPYTYVWTLGSTEISTTADATGLIFGETYDVTVTDSCGVDAIESVLITCPAGKFLNVTSKKCVVCPPGSYSDKPSLTCTRCPANTYTPGGKTVCSPCDVSEISAPGSSSCAPCPPGKKRFAGEATCTNCPAGTYRCGGSGCINCPRGTFSDPGSSYCMPCEPGFFVGTLGATACDVCPAGTYSTGGASSCTTCPLGTTSDVGANEITACN